MGMRRFKGDPTDGTDAVWVSNDALTPYAALVVWRLTTDLPVREKYGIPYRWAVQTTGTYSATGYAKSLKVATEKAAKARAYILHRAVGNYTAPDYLSETAEKVASE